MGCDIHFYVERLENGEWVSADQWEKPAWSDNENYLEVPYDKAFYHDRNYSLFAILANVRNGYGFADVDTGDGFNPIDMPRDTPGDMSQPVAAEFFRWGVDAHSASYFTVQELLSYDWTQVTNKRGVVSAKEYAQWGMWARKHGLGPESYSGGVSGGNVVNVSNAEMDAHIKAVSESSGLAGWNLINSDLLNGNFATGRPAYYTKIQWSEPYYRAARSFWGETMPRLLHVGDPKEVRIVFWFDN